MQHWKLTNKEFAVTIKIFAQACAKAGVVPSRRQASKWRNKHGRAFMAKAATA